MTGNEFRMIIEKATGNRFAATPEKLSHILYGYNKNGNKEFYTPAYIKTYILGAKDIKSSTIEQVCSAMGLPVMIFYSGNVKSIDDSKYNELLAEYKKKVECLAKASNANVELSMRNLTYRNMLDITSVLLKHVEMADVKKRLGQNADIDMLGIMRDILTDNGMRVIEAPKKSRTRKK